MFDIKSFYEAKDVKDAVEALVREPEAEVISGGTDVLIRVREGKDAGRALVSIHNIKELKGVKVDPKDMAHIEAIILSMTPYERRHPEVLKATRKQRIAKGSSRSVEEVNRLLKQFEQMKLMMKQLKSGNLKMPF